MARSIDSTWGMRKDAVHTLIKTYYEGTGSNYLSFAQIAQKLNAANLVSQTGAPFTGNIVSSITRKPPLSLSPRRSSEASVPSEASAPTYLEHDDIEEETKKLTIDDIMELLHKKDNGEKYPVNFDHVVLWLGYSTKSNAITFLKNNFKESQDFQKRFINPNEPFLGDSYWLSVECFVDFVSYSETSKAKESKKMVNAVYREHYQNKQIEEPKESLDPMANIFSAMQKSMGLWEEQLNFNQKQKALTNDISNRLETMEKNVSKYFTIPELFVDGKVINLSYRKKIDYIVKKYAVRIFLSNPINQSPAITEDLEYSKEMIGEFIHRSRSMLNTMVSTVGSLNLKKRATSAGFTKHKIMDYAESEKSRDWFTISGKREKLLVIELMYYIASNMFPLHPETHNQASDVMTVTFEGLMKDIELHNPTKLKKLRHLWNTEVMPLLKAHELSTV